MNKREIDSTSREGTGTMKLKNNVAAKAIAAGLSFALAMGGVAAPATLAFASGTGNITIAKRADGDTTTMTGYQIFTADVADVQGVKVASNVAWANGSVKTIVENAIKAATNNSYSGTTAQDAADWLHDNQTQSGNSVVLDYNSFLDNLAQTLRTADGMTTVDVTPGTQAKDLSAGYWLFLTNEDSTANTDTTAKVDQVGTSPIYQLVGAGDLEITQKTNLPTVDKWINDDSTFDNPSWVKAADSQAGQEVKYKLQGTMVDTIKAYDRYYYKFTDTLDAGLTADLDTVVVKIEGKNEPETVIKASSYQKELSADGQTLTVTFTDLKTATTEDGATVALDRDTKINVYYSAKLDPSKTYKIAGEHNDNTVYLTYSNNPGTESHGNTTPATVRDYTYKLQVTKIDSAASDNKLAGAKFTIKATDPDDTASTGKYVQQNGTLDTKAYEFETRSDGTFSVQGLDAGTYTVKETAAPSGYNTIPDFTFTITPVFNADKTALTKIAAEKYEENGTNVAIAGVETASDSTAQTISLVVSDKAGGTLPLTGQAGVTLTWVAGGVVLAFGITHLVRSRKRDENSAE